MLSAEKNDDASFWHAGFSKQTGKFGPETAPGKRKSTNIEGFKIMLSGEQPFRKGDTVRLRFGRQKMTVIEIDGDGANCVLQDSRSQQVAWVAWQCLVPAGKRPKSSSLNPVRAAVGTE